MHRARPTAAPGSLYLREGHFNATGYDLVGDAVARRLAEELRCRSVS
jgi:lysophospholipase L1-like esterase